MEHGQRNAIISATGDALTLRIEGREKVAPWSIVTGVSAGMAKLDRTSDRTVLVLAFEAELSGREYLFIVGEIEPAWISVTSNLHIGLPEVAPFEIWAAEVLTTPAPLELYERLSGI